VREIPPEMPCFTWSVMMRRWVESGAIEAILDMGSDHSLQKLSISDIEPISADRLTI
jgi:hypothetical protein